MREIDCTDHLAFLRAIDPTVSPRAQRRRLHAELHDGILLAIAAREDHEAGLAVDVEAMHHRLEHEWAHRMSLLALKEGDHKTAARLTQNLPNHETSAAQRREGYRRRRALVKL